MFTICRSLGEIRGQISINNTLLSEQLGGDTLVRTPLLLLVKRIRGSVRTAVSLKYLSAFILCPHQEIPVTSKPLSK